MQLPNSRAVWFNIAANISENQIIIKLFNENNTYLTETAPVDNTNSTREFKILMKYEPDSIIVFKNLQAGIPCQPTLLVEGNKPLFNDLEVLTPYVPYMQLVETPKPEESEEPTELEEPKEPEEPTSFALPITEIALLSAVVGAVVFGIGAYWVLKKRE